MNSETKSTIASAALHAGALGFTLLTFSGATLEATSPPAMPIDLVSTEDFSKLAKGAKDAPKAEEPKPLVEKLAEQPKPAEEQKPKVTEKKAVEATKEATPPPQPEQKPDPIAKKLEQQEKPQAEAKAEKIDRLPPKRPPQKPEPKFDLDKVAALIDKREPVREASAGHELNQAPSLGASKGTEARLSQSEIDALRARLRQCWNPPVGAAQASTMRVVYRVIFKRDGSIAGAPSLVAVQGAGSEHGPVLAESARRALLQCQPYKMLKPEHYDLWKDMEITFDPREMFG